MRILFTRVNNDQHTLELIRDDKSHDRMEFETKSVLMHDLLHFAVESAAGMQDGVWGSLAQGKTLADLNDRTGKAMQEYAGSMAMIEPIVGSFSVIAKGEVKPEQLLSGIANLFEAQGKPIPPWLTKDLILAVQKRMRELIGHWNATPFGQSMELEWKTKM